MTLMKLKHAENKWNLERQRRQFLEEEIKKLRRVIAVVANVQRQNEETGKMSELKCKIDILYCYLHLSLVLEST